MLNFRLTDVAQPCRAHLEAFRNFAAVSGEATDALLLDMLRRAMLAVQEWEDKSLLAARATLVVLDRDDPAGPVHLFLTPSEVVTVEEPLSGEPLEYSLVGTELIPSWRTRNVRVVYDTAPEKADIDALMPKVYRYAAALYDGDDSAALARILQER